MSVINKLRSADTVLFLDEVQYSHGGFTNRNRMPDGSWLTVPVCRDTDMAPLNRVRISEHDDWRRNHVKTLYQHYGHNGLVEAVCAEIMRPYRLLIGLNLALLRFVLDPRVWQFQSHLDGGRAEVAVSEDRTELAPISERLAMMVAEVGGDVYLSGPSGRNYLDEIPFLDRGIEVRYWSHTGPNPCVLETSLDRR